MNQEVRQATPHHATSHTRLGVASFVIGTSTFSVAALWFALVMAVPPDGVSRSRNDFVVFYLAFLFLVAPAAHLVGEVLGFVALFMKNRRKLFAVLGLLVNLPFLVFWILAYSLLYHWYQQGWFGRPGAG